MKLILRSFIAILLMLSSACVFSQGYHHLVLPGDTVQDALSNSDFSYFDFYYKNIGGGFYQLMGTANKADSTAIGLPFLLKKLGGQNAKPLANKVPEARLYLTRDAMIDHNMDGTKNYILTPEKTKDPVTHKRIDQVSYHIGNKVCPNCAIFLQTDVLEFDLNPSPPY
jgi:hypothetical protein